MYAWVGAAKGRKGKYAAGSDELRQENLRLKKELKRVEEERDILKKAAAYFAKASR